ncbi:MAG: hypothetical protein NVSMB65_19440 [Chloroflexota bacterium]
MRRRPLLALLAGGIGLLSIAAAQPAVTLSWHHARPMPRPSGGLAAVAEDGYVFISGGYNGGYQWTGYSARVIGSEPGLNGWRHIAALPTPLYSHVMVGALGSLYVVGGTTNGRDTGAQDAVYRTRLLPGGHTGRWARAGTLPMPVYGHGAVAAGGYLYVAGGYVPDRGYATAVYSMALGQHGFAGRWHTLAHLPQPRFGVALVAGGGYLFAIGGMSQGQPASTVYAAALLRDGAIGGWHAVQSLPGPLVHAGAALAGGWLVVAGGTTGLNLTVPVDTVLAAPLHSGGTLGTWHRLPLLSSPAAAPAVLMADKYLYVLGGFDGKVYSSTVYRACPSFVPACSSPAAPARPKKK